MHETALSRAQMQQRRSEATSETLLQQRRSEATSETLHAPQLPIRQRIIEKVAGPQMTSRKLKRRRTGNRTGTKSRAATWQRTEREACVAGRMQAEHTTLVAEQLLNRTTSDGGSTTSDDWNHTGANPTRTNNKWLRGKSKVARQLWQR